MKRIIIDVTSTYGAGLNTGIQRVVRNIATYIPKLATEEGIDCLLVVFDGKKYIVIQGLDSSSNTKSYFVRIINKIKVWVKRLVHKQLWPLLHNLNTRIKLILEWYQNTNENDIQFAAWQPIEGDVLILADATWNYNPWGFIRQEGKDIQVAHIIYDLLPIKYPHFFTQDLVDKFKLWWLISNYYVDLRLCISQSTANDVSKELPVSIKKEAVNRVFPLGTDIKQVTSSPNFLDTTFLENLNWHDKTFLMVGTLEPRKNYDLVIDACDEIWRQGNESRLVIVGKLGWASPQLMQRILLHPRYGRELLWLEKCSDAQLEHCYRVADCLIAASVDEGYGLPIVEAISRGLSVLASDIEVFREVGKDNVDYFEPGNSSKLAERLISYNSSQIDASLKCHYDSMTWQDACEVFFGIVKSNFN